MEGKSMGCIRCVAVVGDAPVSSTSIAANGDMMDGNDDASPISISQFPEMTFMVSIWRLLVNRIASGLSSIQALLSSYDSSFQSLTFRFVICNWRTSPLPGGTQLTWPSTLISGEATTQIEKDKIGIPAMQPAVRRSRLFIGVTNSDFAASTFVPLAPSTLISDSREDGISTANLSVHIHLIQLQPK
eukprot:GHVU01206762.1.p1 GENE.GHVU01206762.1~~GHVU01206762.1.p1  ORF type:complete len:187 (-),score=4.19 GHVU01206762.1:140-700(-)